MSPHIGLNGTACQCTPERRQSVTVGCLPVCFCHSLPHAECPNARPCIGRCGRLTTAGESHACGYCVHCAADRPWLRVVDYGA